MVKKKKSIVERYKELASPKASSISGLYRFNPYDTNVHPVKGTIPLKKLEEVFIEMGNKQMLTPYQRGFRARGKLKGIRKI